MATLEKPKKEKYKKNKVKPRSEVFGEAHQKEDFENDEPATTTTSRSTEKIKNQVDIEHFEVIETTNADKDTIDDSYHTLSEEAVNKNVENANVEMDKGESLENVHKDQENDSLREELAQASTSNKNKTCEIRENLESRQLPTAPPADVACVSPLTATISINPIIQYPSLTKMYIETIPTVSYQSVKPKSPVSIQHSQLKPYTEDQLKQIYDCRELELVKQFELDFLMNSLLESQETDPLFAALLEYYNLQSMININLQDIEKLRKEAKQNEEKIWTKETITQEFTGRCGDNVTLKQGVTYDVAIIDHKNLEMTSATLKRLFDVVCFTYTTNQIAAHVTKAKIDGLINEAISYPCVAVFCQNASIELQKEVNPETLPCMAHIRRSIAILFSFVRRVSPNPIFDSNLKEWLSQLISLQLLLATKEDHWFLLFNILRCPSGVGSWASKFLQVPCSYRNLKINKVENHVNELPLPLDSPEISNCIAVLQILLFPIKKRNDYLKAFAQDISDGKKEERWIVVDSDGEDSHTSNGECVGLKESDLISFLNQIPFERLFSSALAIEKHLGVYLIEGDLISNNKMLKVVAFFAKFIEILGEGMITYNTDRYKHFAKRLGRLVRHTLQYVFDYHALFISNKLSKDTVICERIAVELNALILKACSYIYRTRNLGTWLYFSSLPFGILYVETVWQLFYYLNVGFPTEFPVTQDDHIKDFNAADFWTKFNVANADVGAEDMYYLLQAFFEMANERDRVKDWELIKSICLHIFNIGYINPSTKDSCYKTARDMLLNLTLAYEDLLSSLLLQLKVRFKEIENAPYLFKLLPLENWKPDIENFEILSNWLLHFDFQTPENMTARAIISHLNWGFDTDGRLFLPHHIHIRMAILISEALSKHAPESVGVSTITESVRQVSNFIDFSHTTKEYFSTWCWNMISLLRLHLMDQSKESRKKTLLNPSESLLFVPELERIDTIFQGVTENRPLAIYVALLVSLHGHSIPLICQQGFELLKLLLKDYRHASVIRALEVIMPLFVHSIETIANCENFQTVMMNLLNADKTYLKMAKNIICSNSIGIVLEMLDNMIHHQVTSYNEYGFSSPINLIQIWLQCLTSLPNWQNSSVLYLLDKLLRVAYQFPDARIQAFEFFFNYYKDCNEWKKSNMTTTIMNLFGSNQSRIPTLSSFQPWLSLLLLEVEYKLQDAFFWSEFLRQIYTQSNKTYLDATLKKTAAIVQMQNFPASMLVIYKYANLIASMDITEPLFVIFNQKFFELYLSRVPLHFDEESYQNTCGVSDKFYEYNVPLMKKIKMNLKAAKTLYKNESIRCANGEALSYFYQSCSKMMNAFELWLEETTINKFSKETINFPPQYCNEKLKEIFQGNTPHWTEFIYLPAIRKEQGYQADQWARKCFRQKSIKHLRSPIESNKEKTPIERIKIHLSSYDKCLEPPKFVKPEVSIQKNINNQTSKELQEQLETLSNYARNFIIRTSELNALNNNFRDNVQKLYTMITINSQVQKQCKQNCIRKAKISITKKEIVTNEVVQNKLKKYHEHHDKIVDQMINQKMNNFAYCIEQIGCTVRALLTSQITSKSDKSVIKSTGVTFFYEIIENLNGITKKFPPTNDCLTQLLSELSIFIQDNQEEQGLTILNIALRRTDIIEILSSAFVPSRTRPEHFIKMYKFLIESHLKRCDKNILFVLFSKFDLETWFSNFQPKLFEIEKLLELVLQGLESWSQPDSSLLQDQFRRHLVHIFNYKFPEHYGEVLQKVLEGISEQKLMSNVLLDLLNALLERCGCSNFDLNTTEEQIQSTSMDFARAQTLFNFKAANDTIMLFGRHFQKERLNHGLHGLYPKHKDYCKPLTMWFSCFGHMLCATAICTYQNLLADQLSDLIFSSLIDMYAPWLVVYTEQTMLQYTPSKWIRQLTDNHQMLLPWSAQHANTSKIIIKSFINTLCFVLEHLPSSHQILAHTFGWYIHHFAIPNLDSSVYVPINAGLSNLPWELFKPQPNNIERLYECLQRFVPEAHSMLGHIFIRIDWNGWFAQTLPSLNSLAQVQTVSRLFTIFVKISLEPNLHAQSKTSKILEDALKHPWHLVEYEELETLLKWFASTIEPSIILKIPTENNDIDSAILYLLRFSCGMIREHSPMVPNFQDSAKRILYTRYFNRLFRNCATKNHKLLASKHGRKAFNAAFDELLNDIDSAVHINDSSSTALVQKQREAFNIIMEIIMPMETQSQEVTNFQIDSIIEWQDRSQAGNMLTTAILTAIGNMRSFIAAIYTLLEATLISYFRISEQSKDYHRPSWLEACRLMKLSLDKLEFMPILRSQNYLSLHIFLLYRLERIENSGDQITFLQDIIQLTESFKTNPQTEAHLAIVWGVIIARGCKILSASEHAKKPLLMFARNLCLIAKQTESWGDLLGAIGLRRENVTNRPRVLACCLACILFNIFPETSESNHQPNQEFLSSMQELTSFSSNKKYNDVKPSIVKAKNIINENKYPNLRDVPHLVSRLIALFYNDTLLTTIPEIWIFDFKL